MSHLCKWVGKFNWHFTKIVEFIHCICVRNIQEISHFPDYVSTSALFGVAHRFATQGTDITDPRTIFQIQNPLIDGYVSADHISACVDVSWISPFPSEHEVIMDVEGPVLLDPRQLRFFQCIVKIDSNNGRRLYVSDLDKFCGKC